MRTFSVNLKALKREFTFPVKLHNVYISLSTHLK